MRSVLLGVWVVFPLLLISGCRNSESTACGGPPCTQMLSVAGAHYFQTGDGIGDETYEVIVHNAGDRPAELSAAFLDGRELKSADPAAAAAAILKDIVSRHPSTKYARQARSILGAL